MDKFYSAVKYGDVDSLVACIMENRNLVNMFTTENGKTAQNIAIENGNLVILEILLWNGSDPSITDESGLDSLKCAQFFNQTECVNLLISHEIYNISLYESCYNIILKGCINWFSEFVKFKKNIGESELNVFNSLYKAYENLLKENVKLSSEMKAKVEIFLMDNNYKKCSDNLQEFYSKIKLDLIKICEELIPSLKTEVFLLKLKLFLKNSSVLSLIHSRLKYNRKNLCWTQIEFLISLFICIREKRQKNNFIYMSLDKKLITSYIQLFLNDLENSENTKKHNINSLENNSKKKLNKKDLTKIIKKLIPKEERIKANKLKQTESKIEPKLRRVNNIRKELVKTYNHLKNLTTIERIVNNIQAALDINLSKDGVIGVYAIRRALQIIGEGVKSTDNSLNISKSIVKNIQDLAPKSLIDITTNLRNVLSHGGIYRYTESINTNDLKQYKALQEELKIIINFLVDLLYKERCYGLKIFFHKMFKCKNSYEVNQLKKYFLFDNNNFSEKYYVLKDQYNEKWKKFFSGFTDASEEELSYIKEINEYLDSINVKYGQKVFDEYLSILNKIKNSPIYSFTRITSECRMFLKTLNGKNKFLETLETSRNNIYISIHKLQLLMKNRPDKKDNWKEFKELEEFIYSHVMTPLKEIKAFKFNLEYIPSFEIEQKITNLFNLVLNGIANSTDIQLEIKRHKNNYFGKKKMIEFIEKNEISMENWNELENIAQSIGLEFKNVKMNYLKEDKFKAIKNIENASCIYGKLFKDMKLYLEDPLNINYLEKAIEKFFNSKEFKVNSTDEKNWIKTILENHQNHADQKIMEYLLKLKQDLVKLVPSNILKDENSFAKEYAKYRENRKLQSAVEMILFEILQFTCEYKYATTSSTLSCHDLRNYLAHGNIFFDVFTIDPNRIIFMNAIKLIAIANNSDLNIVHFSKNIEMNIEHIYEMRSSWIDYKDISYYKDRNCHTIKDFTIGFEYKIGADELNNSIKTIHYKIGKQENELRFADLIPAIQFNNLEIVQILCKRSINLNTIDSELKKTPLSVACEFGYFKIVIELLKYGADISICDSQGNNTLMLAIYYGHAKVVEYLLKHLSTKEENYIHKIVNCVNIYGFHIFQSVIEHAPIKIVKQFVAMKQIDINMPYRGGNFLHKACIYERNSVVRSLVAENITINLEDSRGFTPLLYAIEYDNIKMLKILLKKCQNLRDLLHQSIHRENLNILKILIKNNADTTEIDEGGRNLLDLAIIVDCPEIAIYLIEKKFFDLDLCTRGRQAYICTAAARSSTDVIEKLLQYGNKINFNEKNSVGWTPLLDSIRYNNAAMVKYLVSHGADISDFRYLQYAIGNEIYDKIIPLLECGADVNYIDQNGNSSLDCAVRRGNIYITKILIDFGANIEAYGKNQITPLMKANFLNHFDVVYMLLKAGAQVNLKSIFSCIYCYEFIMNNWRNMGMIKLLLEMDAVVDNCWDVQLTNTIINDVRFSLDNILNTMLYDDDLFSTLLIAIMKNDLQTVQLLGSKKEYVNCESVGNLTPMLLAIVLQNLEIVQILIDYGANVNNRYCQSETPLIFASELEDFKIVEILLEAGADVNSKTINGRTALFYAVQSGQIEIVKLLIRYGGKIDKIMFMSLLDFRNFKFASET